MISRTLSIYLDAMSTSVCCVAWTMKAVHIPAVSLHSSQRKEKGEEKGRKGARQLSF